MGCLLCCLTVFGQSNTSSVYSKYGLGELLPGNSLQNFSLGGTAIGLNSNKSINNLNPASYSSFNATLFEVGVFNNTLWATEAEQEQTNSNTYLNRMAFGFPVVANKWGMSMGLLPHTSIGYDYTNTIDDSLAGSTEYRFLGEGGTNTVFWGNAYKFRLDSASTFSLGINASYLFGSSSKKEVIVYNGTFNAFNLLDNTTNNLKGFLFDAGFQYRRSFMSSNLDKYTVTIGGVYGFDATVSSNNTTTIQTFTGSLERALIAENTSSRKDTILHEESSSSYQLPMYYGLGIAVEKDRKWLVSLDYKVRDWSSVSSESGIFSYATNMTISGGMEYTPQYDAYNDYLKRITYRLGARYNAGYITILGDQLTEYGITFGVSLPMKRTETAAPRISMGIEYGTRATANDNLVKERFLNFNVGITIMDKWFIKRKYD